MNVTDASRLDGLMRSRRRSVDILHVSAGTTRGWRVNDETLRGALEELGVSVARVAIRRPSGGLVLRIGSPGNDLYQAACLVAAAERGLRRMRPQAIIYSSSHAALLQPPRNCPEAVWLDGSIASMREGALMAPVRALERTRQKRLDLVLSMSVQHATEIAAPLRPRATKVLHVPIDPSPVGVALFPGVTPPFGITYAGNPGKKGLDLAIAAWSQAAPTMTLVVSGLTRADASTHLGELPPSNIYFTGPVSRNVHRALVRQAAVYVSASRREELGTAQLEALADGVPVAAVPSRGAAEPVTLVREILPSLVACNLSAESLGACISRALRMSPDELDGYRVRSERIMADYSYTAFKERLTRDVLPVLLPNIV